MDCTVWNERHRTRLACRRPGAGAHRDIERGKVPRAARVECITRSACTSLDHNSNKQNFSAQSGTMGRILGHIYTAIYYCYKSFPVPLHDVMVGGWIASYVFSFLGGSRFRCCCCVLLLLPTTSVLKRREVPLTVSSFSVSATTTAVSFASIILLLLLLRRDMHFHFLFEVLLLLIIFLVGCAAPAAGACAAYVSTEAERGTG